MKKLQWVVTKNNKVVQWFDTELDADNYRAHHWVDELCVLTRNSFVNN